MAPETKSVAPAPVAPKVAAVAKPAAADFKLPTLAISPVDIGRLQRELEQLDGVLLQHGIRGAAAEDLKLPKLSLIMDRLVADNKLDLSKESERQGLAAFLASVKKTAPLLHISFSADPNTAFSERLITWLRQEIHPLTLMTIGIQPNIGAGCVIRTTNKYFDFSLRQDFLKKRDLLIGKLGPISDAPAAPVVASLPGAAG